MPNTATTSKAPQEPAPSKKQTVLLSSEQPRTSGFDAIFKAPSQLGVHYDRHMQEVAAGKTTGQVQISKIDADKYMREYRNAEQPPPENVIRRQELHSDLTRMQRHDVVKEGEKDTELRSEKREKFLASRKQRHDDAVLECEAEIEKLHESCSDKLQGFSKAMKGYLQEMDQEAEKILKPLETNIEALGEQSEAWVQDLLTRLEAGIIARGTKIEEFDTQLQELELFRKRQALDRLTVMVNSCTAAAHCSPGEVERIVDQKSHVVNTLSLENSRKGSELSTKLREQNMENSKKHRRRWYEGLLRWKRQRHQTAVETVLRRIESREFRGCPELISLLARIRVQQRDVFDQRKELLVQVYTTEIDALNSNRLRGIEEQITAINDRTSEETDNFLVELKELKDTLQYKSEGMLNQLRTELEMYDARTEWGDHESVKSLVESDIKPHMDNCLNWIETLCLELANVLQTLDEWAHHTVSNLNTFAIRTATLLETFKQQLSELKMKQQGEIEDCIQDHDDEKARNEGEMRNFKELMEDEVHIEGLDVLLQKTFDKLDVIAQSYRDFARNLLDIHKSYEPKIMEFFEGQTDTFAFPFGLERKLEEEDEDEEEEAAAAEEGAEEEEAKDNFWGEAPEGYSFPLLKKVENDIWRLQVIPAIEDEEGEEGGDDDEDKAVGLPQSVKKELALVDNRIVRMPKAAEGQWTLEELIFKTFFVEDLLGDMRKRLFSFVHDHKCTLDAKARETLAREDERINMELDQTLRRHTNRKGEVQVDWYNPRNTIIEKHKNRFERHMISIAQKSSAQEDEGETCYLAISDAEGVYHERLGAFTEKLQEARNLAALTAVERKGKDSCAQFIDVCRSRAETLLTLAEQGIQSLVASNRDFVRMCKAGGDSYSKSEIVYYKEQTTILNTALEQKKEERIFALEDKKGKLPAMQQEPLDKFLQAYGDAVDKLSQELGLGPVYGAPRRRAQEACRTIMSRTESTLHGIGQYVMYFKDCMAKREEARPLTLDYQLRKQRSWKELQPPPASEMMGAFEIILVGIIALGKHLEAFKSKFTERYKQDETEVRGMCRLDESLYKCPEGNALEKKEKLLLEDISISLLGPIPTSDLYTPAIAKVEQAGKDAYKSGVPDFMAKFLADMKVSTEMHRRKNCAGLRSLCEELRDSTLLLFGPSVFDDFLLRALGELKAAVNAMNSVMSKGIAELDQRRLSHETRLTPSLANPNNARILKKLKDDEAERYRDALASVNKWKLQWANLLHREAVNFLHRLVVNFQTLMRCVDSLPLGTHYNPLPGDENVETQRMSIKRRKRRVFAGHQGEIVVDDETLPPRSWEGVETSLWKLESSRTGESSASDDTSSTPSFWASENDFLQARIENPASAPTSLTYETPPAASAIPGVTNVAVASFSVVGLFEAEQAALLRAEVSPTVESFRSPAHKIIFHKRNAVYEEYKAAFLREVAEATESVKQRLEKEDAGEGNWQNMCEQLVSGGKDDD